ncbi:MAG TPA: tetratricopeptide repeat protein [Candidatus Didemnitutus sp.]|nr:tetratricopeptide repeat protein [Candidatus Didemnitutus sp.]
MKTRVELSTQRETKARSAPASSFERPTTFRGASLLAVALIAVAVLLAYHNCYRVPFIFDDDSSIKENPTLTRLWRAWWPPSEHGLTVSGRPLLNFTLAINYALGGTDVQGYHAVNLLIHLAAAAALFGVVRRTLQLPALAPRFARDSLGLAFAVALVWALHPLQTEAVTYVVQRAESLVGLCYLLTFWCFIRAATPGASRAWEILTVVCCLLGMMAKEVMATAPLMVLLYDRVFLAGSWNEAWKRRGRLHLALGATWLLLLGLVLSTGSRGGTAGFGSVSSVDYALTQVGAVVRYLRLVVWPSPLVFDYGKLLVTDFADVALSALVLIPLVAASVWLAWRGWVIGFCSLFFFAVLAPTSSVIPVATQTVAEHRAYLASASLVALAVGLLYALWGRRSGLAWMAIALIFGVATERRNRDYATDTGIWEDTLVKMPRNTRAAAALGTLYMRDDRLDEARLVLERARQVEPASSEIVNNLGNVAMKQARWDEAAGCFQTALQLKPDQPLVQNNLANALLQLNRVPEAIVQMQTAVRLKPDLYDTRFNLANTLAHAGQPLAAVAQYEEYLQARPDDFEARCNYGNVLLALGRQTDAVAQIEQAAQLRPDSAEIQNSLGVAYAQVGRLPDALARFEEAVRLKPDYTDAQQNAARAAQALGR